MAKLQDTIPNQLNQNRLDFFYCDDYNQFRDPALANGILHAKTYTITDKYSQYGPKNLAAQIFSRYTSESRDDDDDKAFTRTVKWIFKEFEHGHEFRKLAILGAVQHSGRLLKDEDDGLKCCMQRQ
ncbi:hypothetical protein E6O75_ATG03042 [Venturia nashicola]|uniref:Uncharacterized protein n=1 Tax=Venturia nashicola TaxID=86259 RepID=A0A4Z1PDT7_9PEZI|nr:hypothetical protein E6O75_ATG03042 [Venturia nashicola]